MNKECRSLDELGRIVLPNWIRIKLNISPESEMDIYIENDKIVIEPSSHSCCICQKKEGTLYRVSDKYICEKCSMYITKKRINGMIASA